MKKFIVLVIALAMTIGGFSQALTAKSKILSPIYGDREKMLENIYQLCCENCYLSYAEIFGEIVNSDDFSKIVISRSEVSGFFKRNAAYFAKSKVGTNVPFVFLITPDSVQTAYWDIDEGRITASSIFKLEDRRYTDNYHRPLIVMKK